jgi:hypothetical protein
MGRDFHVTTGDFETKGGQDSAALREQSDVDSSQNRENVESRGIRSVYVLFATLAPIRNNTVPKSSKQSNKHARTIW